MYCCCYYYYYFHFFQLFSCLVAVAVAVVAVAVAAVAVAVVAVAVVAVAVAAAVVVYLLTRAGMCRQVHPMRDITEGMRRGEQRVIGLENGNIFAHID